MERLSTVLKRLRWIPAAALIAFFGWVVVGIVRDEAGKYHQQLLQEFQLIRPLAGSAVVDTQEHYSRLFQGKALVGAEYATEADYTTVYQYYDKELSSKGWRFVEEHQVKTMYRNDEGQERSYCKGPLFAGLFYRSRRAQAGWKYALDLTWGVHRCN